MPLWIYAEVVSAEPSPDALEHWLAGQARTLGLSPLTLGTAHPDTLHAYCAAVLRELSARGLLDAEPDIGCYAAARTKSN